jgi:ubiquinone/menaquinone biosynthesis C-methylase UbiE
VPSDNEDYVRGQYDTTANLDTRIAVWQADEAGRSPQDVALDAVRGAHPRHVLEVGSGKGSLAFRIAEELRCEVIALDASSAMVRASALLGVVTILGDVRALPFPNDSFDVVVAAWMLYHVRPLNEGLGELARVLRPGGRLVAITNGRAHLRELWRAVESEHDEPSFSVENGAKHLREHFSVVQRLDTNTHAVFADRASAASYLVSVDRSDLADRLGRAQWPLRATGSTAVFVADKRG